MFFVLLFCVCRILFSVCTDFIVFYVVAFHSFVHYLFENYFFSPITGLIFLQYQNGLSSVSLVVVGDFGDCVRPHCGIVSGLVAINLFGPH